jgi:hypothetical protein
MLLWTSDGRSSPLRDRRRSGLLLNAGVRCTTTPVTIVPASERRGASVPAKSVTNAQSPGSRSARVGVSRRAAWCLAVIAVVALVVVLTARWLYRAKALAGGGNEIGGPVRVGVTVFAPLMAVPAGNRSVNLDLQSVRPRVVVNTAHADIAVPTCVVSRAAPTCSATAPRRVRQNNTSSRGLKLLKGALARRRSSWRSRRADSAISVRNWRDQLAQHLPCQPRASVVQDPVSHAGVVCQRCAVTETMWGAR